jgi:formylmethanofuran dehydrogenase subunit E
MSSDPLPKVACDRCGQTYREGDLVEQNGRMVCPVCFDEPSYQDNRRNADEQG